MDITIAEYAVTTAPPLSHAHVTTLIALAGIQHTGHRRTGKPGHPPRTYPSAELAAAHAAELARTPRPFDGTDWIAAALLGRRIVEADTKAGII